MSRVRKNDVIDCIDLLGATMKTLGLLGLLGLGVETTSVPRAVIVILFGLPDFDSAVQLPSGNGSQLIPPGELERGERTIITSLSDDLLHIPCKLDMTNHGPVFPQNLEYSGLFDHILGIHGDLEKSIIKILTRLLH